MGDVVAVVLDGLDALHLLGDSSVVREHLEKSFGADDDVVGLLVEKVKKTLFARQKALQESRHVG
jgi:hypothetical protein